MLGTVWMPGICIGVVVAAYWYRVLRMARRARRRTGRAANFFPAEPLGRALRAAWIPAILLWLTHPFFTALVHRPPTLMRPVWTVSPWMAWSAVAVVITCFSATRVCWRRMGAGWRMGIDPAEHLPLVATGPFAYVRHPIYALSSLMMLATAAALPSPTMIAVAAVHLTLLLWESAREERYLLTLHGRAYADYCARVGRFLPRLGQRSAASF